MNVTFTNARLNTLPLAVAVSTKVRRLSDSFAVAGPGGAPRSTKPLISMLGRRKMSVVTFTFGAAIAGAASRATQHIAAVSFFNMESILRLRTHGRPRSWNTQNRQ